MLRPVVVAGLDGSRESDAAAHWAAREALRRGLPLRLVHAWEGMPDEGRPPTLPELQAPQDRALKVLRSAGDRLNERYPQLCIVTEQLRRPPGPALLAEAEDAELLVLGSRGFGGVGGFFAGSVAMATVAHAGRPVVLVRSGHTRQDDHLPDRSGEPSVHTPCRDVAVALDVGGPCDEVLEFALRAAQARGAPLRVVHAWHVPYRHGLVDAEERAQDRARAERELRALLEPWREKYAGVFVRETLSEGRPARLVVKAAGGAGLLVVGRRRRRRGAVGSHLGPVAHTLIREVACPVAVVPHD
ncbi:universal stress protein [Streptomyces cavernae]|uniref:universal stress protein n=1 Tax=Streptomyces cavernae TaxID=2259034 RepID=UPI000FEBCA22|nr:universal stress protein [Streptomyces cavernae]